MKELSILARYIFLLFVGLVFYFFDLSYIILPLVIYPVSFLLSLSHEVFVFKEIILVGGISIELIPACLAVSAYFLLIGLNLLVQMKLPKRILSLAFSIFSLTLFNILRIFVLSLMMLNNSAYYDLVHKFLWYFLSIVFVVLIWFLTARLFKIKAIPFYSDFKFMLKRVKRK